MKLTNGSWKAPIFGAGGIVVLWWNVIEMLMDGNPATNPDWSMVITATSLAIAAVFSKDSNVSNAPNPTKEGRVLK